MDRIGSNRWCVRVGNAVDIVAVDIVAEIPHTVLVPLIHSNGLTEVSDRGLNTI
jgi:hypothetical protein